MLKEIIPDELWSLQQKLTQARQRGALFLQNGDVGYASAPSNIALLKYWGKEEGVTQCPSTTSVSVTLGGFRSFTKVTVLGRFLPEGSHGVRREHTFSLRHSYEEGVVDGSLSPKIKLFLDAILTPFAPEISLKVETTNNFPTACGIASSASGYAALAGAIGDLLQIPRHLTPEETQYWLSHWARLGSGSAIRSSWLYHEKSPFMVWERQGLKTTVSPMACPPVWDALRHSVFLFHREKKHFSSSQGHAQAIASPFYPIRVAQVEVKRIKMQEAIDRFDFTALSHLAEEEAFALHAIMATGGVALQYLTQEIAQFIAHFILFRDRARVPAFWTLDAGPNVHILFLPSADAQLKQFHVTEEITLGRPIPVMYNDSTSLRSLILGKFEKQC